MFLKRAFLTIILLNIIHAQHATATQLPYSSSSLHALCCQLFGKENASDEINSFFVEAHNAFYAATENVKQLPRKTINACPFLQAFSSFTWCGTWINAQEWSHFSDNEKTWYAYHETAHKRLHHPTKQLLLALGTPLILGPKKWSSYIFTALITTLYARRCERMADCKAAQTLCNQNKKMIVKEHIHSLNLQDNSWS